MPTRQLVNSSSSCSCDAPRSYPVPRHDVAPATSATGFAHVISAYHKVPATRLLLLRSYIVVRNLVLGDRRRTSSQPTRSNSPPCGHGLAEIHGQSLGFKQHHHNSGQKSEGTRTCQNTCIHWRHCRRQFSFNALHPAVDRIPPKPIAESQKGYTRTVHAHNSQAYESLRVNARLEPECSAMIETLSCCSISQ
jgi:hypothetical protein